ncbi:PTS sugar transporter subunit IIA [Gryllotalpicola reticulitermitis]|uniref:Ascorbate-specific PTS system EIIA component n=1 Tax=Gryllotalpicola reticulitermitis TaxID=1184153 RepID=A0ABV8Q7A0_9MICO
MPLLPELSDEAVAFDAVAADWRAAVRLAGAGLVRAGAATELYTERMIAVVDDFGPYIVVAPGLALAHARPGKDVRADGLSLVTLAEPVSFGHPHNDPVEIVIGLTSATNDAHVTNVAALANLFNDPAVFPALRAATTPDEARAVFRD